MSNCADHVLTCAIGLTQEFGCNIPASLPSCSVIKLESIHDCIRDKQCLENKHPLLNSITWLALLESSGSSLTISCMTMKSINNSCASRSNTAISTCCNLNSLFKSVGLGPNPPHPFPLPFPNIATFCWILVHFFTHQCTLVPRTWIWIHEKCKWIIIIITNDILLLPVQNL